MPQTRSARPGIGKIIAVIFIILLILLLAADLFAGNYLVTFAVARKKPDSRSVAPTPATTSDTQKRVDDNAALLADKTQAWLADHPREQVEITSDDGLKLTGDIVMSTEPSHQWAIVVHGYSSQRIYMFDFACMWAEKGYNVLVPDLRGHGDSEGDYIGMGWLDRKDMLHWIDLICSRDADAEIILHGVSMGGATVMMTAGEALPENVRAVVDDCGYTSVHAIFSDELAYLFNLPDFPFLYTASGICKLRAGYSFEEASAIEQIQNAQVPILFLHGSQDNFVHTDMVYELYDACPTQKDLYVAQDAGHAQAFYIEPEIYTEKVFGFLDGLAS